MTTINLVSAINHKSGNKIIFKLNLWPWSPRLLELFLNVWYSQYVVIVLLNITISSRLKRLQIFWSAFLLPLVYINVSSCYICKWSLCGLKNWYAGIIYSCEKGNQKKIEFFSTANISFFGDSSSFLDGTAFVLIIHVLYFSFFLVMFT